MLQIKERQEMAEVFNEIDINLDGYVRLQEVIDSH